ncbi:unnamed protein product [Ectocarpus sp. 8 AP-2014]
MAQVPYALPEKNAKDASSTNNYMVPRELPPGARGHRQEPRTGSPQERPSRHPPRNLGRKGCALAANNIGPHQASFCAPHHRRRHRHPAAFACATVSSLWRRRTAGNNKTRALQRRRKRPRAQENVPRRKSIHPAALDSRVSILSLGGTLVRQVSHTWCAMRSTPAAAPQFRRIPQATRDRTTVHCAKASKGPQPRKLCTITARLVWWKERP